jgi:hypothetical protein
MRAKTQLPVDAVHMPGEVAKYYFVKQQGFDEPPLEAIAVVTLQKAKKKEEDTPDMVYAVNFFQSQEPNLEKDPTPNEKSSITFQPFLKTKMIGVLGPSFLRAKNEHYRKIYDDYKNRLLNREDLSDETAGHINNMAIRFMVKMFLADLWVVWRQLEGLPVTEPYAVAKLGMAPHGA